jgi:hypothetical protein
VEKEIAMKNIFLSPTEQPSKLVLREVDNKLVLHTPITRWHGVNQYVYITSDEEIREDDWYMTRDGKPKRELFNLKRKGRVILTTNPSLIEDGVQDIDDTFIEWLVKNPTREFVHVEKGFSDGTDYGFNFIDYQIVLPKTSPANPTKCYDKFNQLLKEGDYVDVQRDGVHQIYKKDNGELYFAPYGEEDRVSAYFSNDLAKCNKDGYWINNDRYEDIEEPTQYPIGGFAPGSYWCNCVTCKEKFMGDKKAVQCEPCAIEMVNIKVKINEQGGIEEVKEEHKQETLKDAAINYSSYNEQINKAVQEAVIFGAEWQAKRMYSEEDMIEFNEWVSLNFPNQHNYLRALQKRSQGLDVPKEHLVGYSSTKELLEKFKKK